MHKENFEIDFQNVIEDLQVDRFVREEEKTEKVWVKLFWPLKSLALCLKMKDCDFPAPINDRLSCDASVLKTNDEDDG